MARRGRCGACGLGERWWKWLRQRAAGDECYRRPLASRQLGAEQASKTLVCEIRHDRVDRRAVADVLVVPAEMHADELQISVERRRATRTRPGFVLVDQLQCVG